MPALSIPPSSEMVMGECCIACISLSLSKGTGYIPLIVRHTCTAVYIQDDISAACVAVNRSSAILVCSTNLGICMVSFIIRRRTCQITFMALTVYSAKAVTSHSTLIVLHARRITAKG